MFQTKDTQKAINEGSSPIAGKAPNLVYHPDQLCHV
jgi:hypothetical protein